MPNQIVMTTALHYGYFDAMVILSIEQGAPVQKTNRMMNHICGCFCAATLLAIGCAETVSAEGLVFSSLTELRAPVADGAREPSLSTIRDGRVLMSWTEPEGVEFAVKTAIADASGWSAPQTVIKANNLFVNWADFPSVIALSDGTLAAHWLQINGDASYQYDVKIALSDDEGKTWGTPFIPHDDRSQREHGFVSLLPGQAGELTAIWLDGRSYDTYGSQDDAANAMQLRARAIASDGVMADDTLLDERTCTCCQTSAVVTKTGTVLAVYRDRSPDEIRDISIVRKTHAGWSAPTPVAVDGWHIEGCPVNGPAIDSDADQTVVAWFTAANDVPKVKVAFSNDDGINFGTPLQIDNGAPSGRVDVLQTGHGPALVSWVEYTSQGEAVLICAVTPASGCKNPKVVDVSPTGRTVGFPRMAEGNEGVVIAWTEPSRTTKTHPEGGTTIRTILVGLGDQK